MLPYCYFISCLISLLLKFLLGILQFVVSLWAKLLAAEAWAKPLQRLTSPTFWNCIRQSVYLLLWWSQGSKVHMISNASCSMMVMSDPVGVSPGSMVPGQLQNLRTQWLTPASTTCPLVLCTCHSEVWILSLSVVDEVSKQQCAVLFEVLLF